MLRRNTNSTSPASTMPIRIASRTLAAAPVTSSVWSYQLAIRTPAGICAAKSASRCFTSLGDLHAVAVGLLVDLQQHRVLAVGVDADPLRHVVEADRRHIAQPHHAVGAGAQHDVAQRGERLRLVVGQQQVQLVVIGDPAHRLDRGRVADRRWPRRPDSGCSARSLPGSTSAWNSATSPPCTSTWATPPMPLSSGRNWYSARSCSALGDSVCERRL